MMNTSLTGSNRLCDKIHIKAGKKTQGDLRNHILTETLTEHFLDDMMLVRDAKG